MFNPSSNPAKAGKCGGRSLTVLELAVLIEELDRVVGELEEAMIELALPLDAPSRLAAGQAILAARRAA